MKNELYYVIEYRKTTESILFSGSKEECCKFADEKRKEYRERFGDDAGIIIDCSVQSESERKEQAELKEWKEEVMKKYTEDELKETIIVDGKEYYKVWYEENQKRKNSIVNV